MNDQVEELLNKIKSLTEENSRLKADVELRESRIKSFEEALLQSPLAVCHHDLDLRYTWIHHPHMGFNSEDVIGKTDFDILDQDLAGRMAVIKKRVLKTGIGEQHVIPTTAQHEQHTEYFDMRTEARRDDEGNIIGLVCTGIDVTELIRANTQLRTLTDELEKQNVSLEQLSQSDPLTKIPNRRSLDNLFNELAGSDSELKRSEPLSILMIDVDRFKSFNDHFGHLAGDDVLYQVASIISSYANRPYEMAARYGGEEFVLVLPGTDLMQAQNLAESLRTQVHNSKIIHPLNEAGVVTLSIGIATRKLGGNLPLPRLLSVADGALYEAKSCGRNCVKAKAV